VPSRTSAKRVYGSMSLQAPIMGRAAMRMLVLALALGLAVAQSTSKSVGSSYEDHAHKKEHERAEYEWPDDIVQTGERTGLGSLGYVEQLRKNCLERNIQGACEVLAVGAWARAYLKPD